MQKKSFNLESSLYSEEHIRQAITDFGWDFSIENTKGELTITGEDDTEIQMIFDEFMNYVLALSSEQL